MIFEIPVHRLIILIHNSGHFAPPPFSHLPFWALGPSAAPAMMPGAALPGLPMASYVLHLSVHRISSYPSNQGRGQERTSLITRMFRF